MVLVPVRRSFLGLAAMVAACLWSASAEADIVSTTGDIDVLSIPPTSVTMSGKGILVSDSYIYTFAEQTNSTNQQREGRHHFRRHLQQPEQSAHRSHLDRRGNHG